MSSHRHAVLGLPLLLLACGEGSFAPITELPRALTVAETGLVDADNRFATKLFREVASAEPGANIFISPLSVGMALGMTYNGAAGATREAMAAAMALEGLSIDEVNAGYRDLIDLLVDLDPRVTMTIANSIWHRAGLPVRPAFIDATRTFFDAQVEALDFADPSASNVINDWVKEHTNDKIAKIVPDDIPPEIIMYLINAIYFKGSWTSEFDPARTAAGSFTLDDGVQVQTDLMHTAEAIGLHSGRVGDVALLELPYGGGAYAMTIALPDAGTPLRDVLAGLDDATWNAWTSALDSAVLDVIMPTFTFEYETSLNDALEALGMGVAFTDAADFSNLIEGAQGVYIDEVRHKTFVEVNEEGTEAAAVTSVGVGATSVGPPTFTVDRPFIFVIRERYSGAIIFVGALYDPRPS